MGMVFLFGGDENVLELVLTVVYQSTPLDCILYDVAYYTIWIISQFKKRTMLW